MTPCTVGNLIQQLTDARGKATGKINADLVRFRMAVPYSDYHGSAFDAIDPFGIIAGVTVTLDGTTLVDIVPELVADKQGALI